MGLSFLWYGWKLHMSLAHQRNSRSRLNAIPQIRGSRVSQLPVTPPEENQYLKVFRFLKTLLDQEHNVNNLLSAKKIALEKMNWLQLSQLREDMQEALHRIECYEEEVRKKSKVNQDIAPAHPHCMICHVAPATLEFRPCRHRAMCMQCASQQQSLRNTRLHKNTVAQQYFSSWPPWRRPSQSDPSRSTWDAPISGEMASSSSGPQFEFTFHSAGNYTSNTLLANSPNLRPPFERNRNDSGQSHRYQHQAQQRHADQRHKNMANLPRLVMECPVCLQPVLSWACYGSVALMTHEQYLHSTRTETERQLRELAEYVRLHPDKSELQSRLHHCSLQDFQHFEQPPPDHDYTGLLNGQ